MCNKTRMEKGKESCSNSPTLNEDWIKGVLGENVYDKGSYDARIVKNNVEEIIIFNKYLEICYRNDKRATIAFIENR